MLHLTSKFHLLLLLSVIDASVSLQTWTEQPRYTEVNPWGQVVMTCKIQSKQGQCRWEKDGSPVGIQEGKYEWAAGRENGDCSLKIINATLEFDDGVWQCQVTPSSFNVKDALISEGAQLVVRESPVTVQIHTIGDEGEEDIVASAGEMVQLKCIVHGGNPPAKIRWFARDQEIKVGHEQENVRNGGGNSRTWRSISRLDLPVSKSDNGINVRCIAEHPTLDMPLSDRKRLTIHYPPTVTIESSNTQDLEEGKDSVTIRCLSDSNPPADVLWRKEDLPGIFSADREITISPVTRHTAGTYSCTAENSLGMSQVAYVKIGVLYSPSITSIGPSKIVSATVNQRTVLRCDAEGNPPPQYQWLQKLPTSSQVLIRGNEKELVIDNASYDHQGEFVCKVTNIIHGEPRSVQSESIKVEVSGKPQIMRYSVQNEVRVQSGQDATLEMLFCGNPRPSVSWHLYNGNMGQNIELTEGSNLGRFVAESVRGANKEDCFFATLRINGAHADDSHGYRLTLANAHGEDSHIIHLKVGDHDSQQLLIIIVVASVLAVLLLILIIIYCCKAERCCCNNNAKKDFKPTDLESDKTDLESTHSSHLSGFPTLAEKAIPPDALYVTKEHIMQRNFDQDNVFNDSKESLRPDSSHSNIVRTPSSSPEDFHNTSQQQLQQPHQQLSVHSHPRQFHVGPPRIVYDDLCFPKTSNYGSMKKKKKTRDLLHQNMILSSGLRQQQQQQQQPERLSYASSAHNGVYA